MFQKIVERLLNKILGEYVQDFNSDNLKIGLWSGQVVLKDVKLKKETMKKFNLPFKLRYSKLRCLKMNIPWSSLTTSKIQVLIEGLQLLISQVQPSQWQLRNQKIIQLRKQQIKAYTQSILNDFAQKAQQQNSKRQKDDGYFSNMVVKIIDNLQVTIKDIHIRYQDQIHNQYSFGATLQQLNIFTVDQNDKPMFIDRTKKQYKNQPLRKKLVLSNFGVYWNQKSQFFNQQSMGQTLKQTIARKTNPTQNQMNYIILMSFQARLLQRQKGQQFKDPEIDLFLDFDGLKIEISNKQLQQMVNMGQRLQTFSTQVKRKNKAKLSKQQIEQNIKFIQQIFPQFYKNQKLNPTEIQRLEGILQKMEVQTFKPMMKKYLHVIQKERIVNEKRAKSRRWFSGPKEITQDEMKQIQSFLQSNFGKQVAQVTRPKDFFHTRVNLKLKILQVIISNSQNNSREGIRTKLLNIGTQFKLRQAGYWLQFGINDIYVDLFKKTKGYEEENNQFLKKLTGINQNGESAEYVRLIVEGSPLDRPYVDTYINLVTEQLLLTFDPKIINIATNFANIKINAENSSAALEKYGQIKEETAKSVNQTLQSKKKSFIYIDMTLKSITAILYFDPSKPSQDIWAITLGQTKIYTDKQTLQKTVMKPDEPTQKYSLELNQISFRYFKDEAAFMQKKISGNLEDSQRLQDVLTNLNIDVTLSLYVESTTQVPKIHAQAEMSQFKANLTAFTYQNLQKIGNCFTDRESQELKIQQRSQQKSDVLKNAKKIGFIYIEDSSLTKSWKKYIAVISDNYLYLYKDKKDINYFSYYYVRNSETKALEKPDPLGKQFSFQLKNKVNSQVFGFEKKNTMDDWIEAINKCRDLPEDMLPNLHLSKTASQIQKAKRSDEKQNKITKSGTDPNLLNFIIGMRIQAITIKTYLNQQVQKQDVVQISLTKLNLTVNLHEQKTIVKLSLLSIDLTDNILQYKMGNLAKFLYTQRSSQQEKLIDIRVSLINEAHSQYLFTDTQVDVSFGKLICNYKAETVSSAMKFFLPPSSDNGQNKKQQETSKKEGEPNEEPTGPKVSAMSSVLPEKMQRFSLKVILKMNQISVRLINTKTKIFFAQISMENFQMMFGISDLRMIITGGLQQLSLIDYSNYPNTIIQQKQKYDHFKYIMTSEKRQNNLVENQNQIPHLIFFDVNMLNRPNQAGKEMIIVTQINGLKVSYIQQPVLRLITYLNTQLLPSLSPENGPTEKVITSVTKNEKTRQQKVKQMQLKDNQNSTKPQINTMDLSVTVRNINVQIQPRNTQNEQLKLNINSITVKNTSIYRDFIKDSTEKVLVENYDIRLTDISIFVVYPHPKTQARLSYKLTPDIDFKLSVDLIQNALYYQKNFGNKFQNGMRIQTWMSDFFMRINHEDYNFIMKCLYWNIIYDDNAQLYLFDVPEQSPEQKKQQIPPLYFDLRIQSISLFVIQGQLPLAFMLLNSLDLKFTKAGNDSMLMRLQIQNLIGSSLVHKDNNVSIQRGMFNSFAYQKEFKTDQLRDLDKLLQFFQRKNQLQDKKGKKPIITFQMDTNSEGNSFIGIKIQQLKIVVEMKTLLVLSQLAVMQQYIQPPKSKIQPLLSEQQVVKEKLDQIELRQTQKPTSGKSQIHIELKDFLASLTDTQKQNFFIIDGQIFGKMILYPAQQDQQIVKLSKGTYEQKFLEHSNFGLQLRKFSIYFCNIQDMKKKRYVLKPFSIIVSMNKAYQLLRAQKQKKAVKEVIDGQSKDKKKDMKQRQKKSIKQYEYKIDQKAEISPAGQIIVLMSQIQAKVDNLIFEASIRDLIKINEIIQDNLANINKDTQVESKMQGSKEEKKQEKKEKEEKKEQKLQQRQTVQRTKTRIQKLILDKTKVRVNLKPIQFLVINDCEQNFMPVLKFIIQQTIPTFQLDILQGRLTLVLTFDLSFFNPRSSKFQPVIQNFSANFDYLNLVGEKHNVTKMILTNSPIEQLKQLKINISTQFIASLMTTLEKSKEQQKNIKNMKDPQTKDEIEVSPFILQNITNKPITIKRTILNAQNDFVLKPMFQGTVRLTENSENLQFTIGQNSTSFKMSLQHYGVIKINTTAYYVQFKVDKLNRIIRFLSDTVLQNQLSHTIYVKRYFKSGQVDEKDFPMQKKQLLALDGVKSIQVSLNKKSYSEKADINLIKSMNDSAAIKALNEKFLLWITKRQLANKFTTLEIWPPLLLYNCLPKQFTVQFIVGDKVHTKEISAQTVHEVNANIDFYQLKYKVNVPGFYWSLDFQMREDVIGKQMGLQLKDRQNGSTTINYIFDKTKRGYMLIIYCKSFLVSQLQDDILAYGNLALDESQKRTEKYYVLGGQRAKSAEHDDDIVIIGSQYGSKLRICGDGCMVDFSQPFSLGGIGMIQNRRIVIKRDHNEKQIDIFTTIGVDVAVKQMFKNIQIFSKMITIHWRAIIVNSTTKKFEIRQQGSTKDIFAVQKGQKKNLYFTMPENPGHPRGIVFRTEQSSPSSPVNISELGTSYFRVMNKVSQEEQFYKILIQQVSRYIFYQITELTQQSIPYQIQNLMPKAKVLLKFNNLTLSEGQKFSFINQNFDEQHNFTIRITHANSSQQKDITVRPDDLNFLHRQPFDVEIGGMRGTVHAQIKVKFDDKKKFIIIDEISHKLGYDTDEQQEQYEISSMNIRLEKITFSFIQNHISIDKPFQSFSLFLKGLQFIDQETNLESKYQIRLNYLQLDQDEPFNMPNPVIITPYRMKQFLRQQKPIHVFNAYINKNKRFKQNTFINNFQVQFKDIVVKISQYFIDVVMQMTKQFVEVINYKEEDYLIVRKVDKWNQLEVPKEGAKTFIKNIIIAPFVVQVSAQIKLDQLDTKSFLFFGTILNAVGVVITNIEGAPISLDGIQLHDCVDTLAGINQKLINHYKNTVIKQFYKVFGSLNIIGNPIGLFRNISTGIKDLKDKPSEGFVQGPLQFGRGLAEGTTSLIAHSIGGALNSVSKVTGTISTGLAVLAFDKQFEQLRQKQKMQKPQHVFEGLEKGGKAVFYGFREGIKGVFMQPYENTKKQGIVGLFKGTAKGLAGLIVKPVTGVIDFASKTTQGLKNTALYLQDKPNQNRMRYPRVFYTQCCTVRQYDEIDSKLNAIINKMKYEGKYQESFYIQSYLCDDGRYLLVLQDNLVLCRIQEQKISWVINMKDVRIMKNDQQRKQIQLKDEVQYTFKKSDHTVKMQSDVMRQKITNQIKIMQTQYHK